MTNTHKTMTREQLKGRQSPGEVWQDESTMGTLNPHGENRTYTSTHSGWTDPDYACGQRTPIEECHANAALYAEAHNVANETGMWPLDMLARIRELEAGLKALMDEINPINHPVKKWNDPANDILQRGIGSRTMPQEEAVLFAYRAILNKP